jgi:glucan exporter ATP-binding protein
METYLRVLRLLAPERGVATLLFGANVVLAGLQFVEPWLFGRVIDALVSAQAQGRVITFAALLPLVAAWVGVGLVNIAAGVTVSLHADRLSHRMRLGIVSHYFRHVLSMPLSFHVGTHSGRVMKVMLGGAEAMWLTYLGFFREHAASLVALFVLLPCALLFEWRLGLLLSALVLSFALGMSHLMRGTQARQIEANEQHAALSEHASDALGNLPVVQSFTRIEAEISALEVIGARLLAAQMPVLAWWAAASVATRAAATLTLSAVLLLGTYLHQQASVGQIVACMGLAGTLIGKLEATLTFLGGLFSEAPKLAEHFEVLDQAPSVRDAPGARPAGKLHGDVRFEHVSFSYDDRRVAVDDVSFEAARGQVIALVGATGSGKSTTLGLLYRAYDPSAGRITIDGIDLRAYTLDSLRQNIAVVFQEPLLFARSVRENLLVGCPDASDAALWQALERAQAKALVEAMPSGLDTVLSERGRSLSGGERQRLSIARALIKAPPILILDEPTAALDASTEQLLARALDEVMRDRTTFVIAHRLATVRNATRILVLDRGQLVESGTFEELVAQEQRFAALARAQLLA